MITKAEGESQTAFAIRCVQAEAWDRGYTSGHSNAMRQMSDEPNAPTTPNPFLVPAETVEP